jgi:hypothetical protein
VPRLRPVDASAEVLVDDWALLAMDLTLLAVGGGRSRTAAKHSRPV